MFATAVFLMNRGTGTRGMSSAQLAKTTLLPAADEVMYRSELAGPTCLQLQH